MAQNVQLIIGGSTRGFRADFLERPIAARVVGDQGFELTNIEVDALTAGWSVCGAAEIDAFAAASTSEPMRPNRDSTALERADQAIARDRNAVQRLRDSTTETTNSPHQSGRSKQSTPTSH